MGSALHSNIQVNQDDGRSADTQTKPRRISKKGLYALLVLLLVAAALLLGVLIGGRKVSAPKPSTATVNTSKSNTKSSAISGSSTKDDAAPITCDDGTKVFADKSFGAAFCYPIAWGTATLADAKVGAGDTGHRQQITFSAMPLFSAGGVSEDWSTTIGRDVGCLEPTNAIPALGSYNTAWHDISGSGMAVDFATRSLPSVEGGYSIVETVSSLMQEGVCAQGFKQINGSRYKIISAAFYRTFAEASGITTPSAHISEPNILFSSEQRAQFDALLASLVAY